MENDIPALAYIEAQILGRAVASGSIGCHVTATEDEYGLAPGSLGKGVFWETRVLSLLYTLILFPKEHWKMGPNDPVYAEIARQWSLRDNVAVTAKNEKYDSIHGFIHRLRNALAHANVKFHKDTIEIWDSRMGRDAYHRAPPAPVGPAMRSPHWSANRALAAAARGSMNWR